MVADTSGEQDIRGINIDKLAKGFADEEMVMKNYVTVTPTSAREIRWYAKTAGFLTGTVTTGITTELMANTDQLALPTVVEQSWTRTTSYVRKYFVESPMISSEDIKDSDIDVLATNIRDLTRAVGRLTDVRIWDVLREEGSVVNIQEVAITHEWDDPSNATVIINLMDAIADLRTYNYDPVGAILLINSATYKDMVNWLTSQKGTYIPQFSSEITKSGVVLQILGLKVVVSNIVTTDFGMVFVPSRAATWKTFVPITAATVPEVGIGTKIRVWEEGECILTDPKAVVLLSNIGPS